MILGSVCVIFRNFQKMCLPEGPFSAFSGPNIDAQSLINAQYGGDTSTSITLLVIRLVRCDMITHKN